MPLKLHMIADAAKVAHDFLFGGNIIKRKMPPLQGFKRHWAYNLLQSCHPYGIG